MIWVREDLRLLVVMFYYLNVFFRFLELGYVERFSREIGDIRGNGRNGFQYRKIFLIVSLLKSDKLLINVFLEDYILIICLMFFNVQNFLDQLIKKVRFEVFLVVYCEI